MIIQAVIGNDNVSERTGLWGLGDRQLSKQKQIIDLRTFNPYYCVTSTRGRQLFVKNSTNDRSAGERKAILASHRNEHSHQLIPHHSYIDLGLLVSSSGAGSERRLPLGAGLERRSSLVLCMCEVEVSQTPGSQSRADLRSVITLTHDSKAQCTR